jgi:hypothetical protein
MPPHDGAGGSGGVHAALHDASSLKTRPSQAAVHSQPLTI